MSFSLHRNLFPTKTSTPYCEDAELCHHSPANEQRDLHLFNNLYLPLQVTLGCLNSNTPSLALGIYMLTPLLQLFGSWHPLSNENYVRFLKLNRTNCRIESYVMNFGLSILQKNVSSSLAVSRNATQKINSSNHMNPLNQCNDAASIIVQWKMKSMIKTYLQLLKNKQITAIFTCIGAFISHVKALFESKNKNIY